MMLMALSSRHLMQISNGEKQLMGFLQVRWALLTLPKHVKLHPPHHQDLLELYLLLLCLLLIIIIIIGSPTPSHLDGCLSYRTIEFSYIFLLHLLSAGCLLVSQVSTVV